MASQHGTERVPDAALTAVEPIAVLGYSMELPQGIDSGERLYEVVREKRQIAAHRDVVGYPAKSLHEDGTSSAWKYRPLRGNYFTPERVNMVDRRLLRISQKEARFMSFLQTALLESVWRAIEDAGLRAEDLYRSKTGIFVGAFEALREHSEAPDETTIRGVLSSSLADRIGFFLGTHGPSITIDTACSSSMVALATAVSYLRKGDCNTALVVTIGNRCQNHHLLMMQAVGVLSPSGYSCPFDENSDGMGRAEGWGCLVLRRMSDAERDGNRIVATVANATAGAAGPVQEATEGAGRSYEATCAAGIYRVMTSCYDQVGVPLEEVRYVEAHATGTRVGDLIELQAIARAFRGSHHLTANPLRVASIKGNIGHAESAAGLFSLIKALEMLRHRTFLPTGGLTKPRTDFDWRANNMLPAMESEAFPEQGPIYIGVNSFGIGGGYAHVALTEYKRPAAAVPRALRHRHQQLLPSHYLLPLSAVSEDHLSAYEESLVDYLETHSQASLVDICGTFASNRSAMKYRRVYVTSSVEDLRDQLRRGRQGGGGDKEAPTVSDGSPPEPVAMVFTGQGAQWLRCGEDLMCLPVYRRTVAAVDTVFTQLAGWSLREVSQSITDEDLMQTQYAQPITFMVQVGLLEVLKSMGIGPSVVMGHSAGEVPAAYAAGLLTLDEAVAVVYRRSQEQQKLAGSGRMLAVGLGESAIAAFLAENAEVVQHGMVEVACVNSPNSTVLAGAEADLKALSALLPNGTFAAFVTGNIAVHCSLTQPIVSSLRKRLSSFLHRESGSRSARVPYISTVSGNVQEGGLDADYWVANVRQPVRFQQAVETLCHLEPRPGVVIEIGPHRTLLGPLMQTVRAQGMQDGLTALPTLKRRTNDMHSLLSCLGQLSLLRHPVRLPQWYRHLGYTMLTDLPRHPILRRPLVEPHRVFSHILSNYERGGKIRGPHAGLRVGLHGVGITKIEVSEAACPHMMDHSIGGNAMLPGTYYVSAAIEASGGVPCLLTDVEFVNRCLIPKAGEDPSVLSTWLEPEHGGRTSEAYSFKVRSTPLADVDSEEEEVAVLHCHGKVLRHADLLISQQEGGDVLRVRPSMPGAMELELRDIGRQGIADLRGQYPLEVASSSSQAYSVINADPTLVQYGPTFQLLQELHMKGNRREFLARLAYTPLPGASTFAPQLLDALMHVAQLHPDRDPSVIYYNGGFDVAYYLRVPQSAGDIYVKVDRIEGTETLSLGRTITQDNIHVYDSNGRLLVAVRGTKAIWGGDKSTVRPCHMSWQPYLTPALPSSPPPTAALAQNEGSAAIAEWIRQVALQKAKVVADGEEGERVLVRVLYCVEEEEGSGGGGEEGREVDTTTSTKPLLHAIADLPSLQDAGVVVEMYTATHDTALLDHISTMANTTASGADKWLRTRRALFPAALADLRHFAFDVIVLQGATGTCGWRDVVDLNASLQRLACPGAHIIVREVGGEEAAAAAGVQHKEELHAVLEKMAGGQPAQTITATATGKALFITARVTDVGHADKRGGRTLVVADNQELGRRYTTAAGEAAEVLLCGGRLSDDATVEEWIEVLRPYLSTTSSTTTSLLTASDQGAVRSIVFLAGMCDESPLSADGFHRLLSLFKAIAAILEHDDAITSTNKSKAAAAALEVWVVTRGCFSSQAVNVGQASLYAVTRHIEAEVTGIQVRYADVDTVEEGLSQLASLVASCPSERNFRLVRGSSVPLVQRYFDHDVRELNCRRVSSEDEKLSYHAQVYRVDEGPVLGQVCTKFVAEERRSPASHEVTVQIKAAGLNFRDVMLAISLLPVASLAGSAFGNCLGMEAAGIVTAVGSDVTDVKVGDRVVTSEPSSFASFQNVPWRRVYHLPSSLSLEAGAAATGVYNTAHYALVHLARVRKGERVLVHAAAGGVGQAAVSICRYLGAEVYVTVSKAKRRYVQEDMGVPADRIFDSRATTWFDDVMHATGWEGVHVVLNSLAGKHQQLGLEALAPKGRFLEIGKMDIYKNSAVGQASLCKNGSFFAIDMDRLALDDPELTRDITHEVFGHLDAGHYRPVPVTCFAMDRIKDAMEYMKSGKHIGKIVLVNQTEEAGGPVSVLAKLPGRIVQPSGLYLVTGGAGGFGSRIVSRIVEQGARHVVVTVTKDASRIPQLFAEAIADGVRVDAVVADLSKKEDVAKVVAHCTSFPSSPLRGIFHCSGVNRDVPLADITRDDLKQLAGPKNHAAWWLHEATLHLPTPLDIFAMVSSASADMCAQHMLLYAATNAMLNSLARHRRSLGLHTCALNMTSLTDVGIVANNARIRQAQTQAGVEFITSKVAMDHLVETILSGREALVEWQLRHDTGGYGANRVSVVHCIREAFTLGATATERKLNTDKDILAFLVETIKSITKSPDVLPKAALANLGLDSLSLMELTGRIKAAVGVDLPTARVGMTTTVEQVVEMVRAMVQAEQEEEGAERKGEEEGGGVGGSKQLAAGVHHAKTSSAVTRVAKVNTAGVRSVFEEEDDDNDDGEGRAVVVSPIKPRQKGRDSNASALGCLPSPGWVRDRRERRQASLSRMVDETAPPMTLAEANMWFKKLRGRADFTKRLLVIPSAGAGTDPFVLLDLQQVEVIAVQIPGRPGREGEEQIRDVEILGRKIAEAMEVAGLLEGKPISLIGHSAGTAIAYEVCIWLKKNCGYVPERILNIGLAAPHELYFYRPVTKTHWVACWLYVAGGSSSLFYPLLPPEEKLLAKNVTKDVKATLLYYKRQMGRSLEMGEKIECPILVLGGSRDILTRLSRVSTSWSRYTTKGTSLRLFKGDHYFIFDPKNIEPVCKYIESIIHSST